MFFFRRTDLVTSYGFVIALKGICAAVAMVFYLSHKFKTKDNKYKVIEGYAIEYIGNTVYLTNPYTRIKLSKNQMEEITSEYCKA